MQLLVLLGLAALWIAVLLPDILRRRSTRRPIDTITSFKRHLSVLERQHARTSGGRMPMASNVVAMGSRQSQQSFSGPVRPLVVPSGSHGSSTQQAQRSRSRSQVASDRPTQTVAGRSGGQQRRQDVIVALMAGSLLTLLASLTFSGLFLYLHVVIDVALVAYVAAVLAVTRRNQARSKVSYLRTGQAQHSSPNMAMVSSRPTNRSIAR